MIGPNDDVGEQMNVDTEYLETAKRQIERWETQGPGFLMHLGNFLLLPAENAAKAMIPSRVQEAVAAAIENLLSSLSSATELIVDEQKIYHRLEAAYNESGDELRAADAAARHYWNWNLACAAGEGGATGAIGLAGLAADVPALFTISLRLIRQVGVCYGYDMRSDVEQEYLMHILRVGSTSNLKAKMEFLISLKQIEQILLKVTWRKMSEALARKELSRLSLLAAMRQLAQRIGIQLTKRKALQLVPVIGALIGASFNGLFVNDVGRASYMLYRRRRIAELEGLSTTTLGLV
jgi:hypothetical protein